MPETVIGQALLSLAVVAYIAVAWFPVGYNKQLLGFVREFKEDARSYDVAVDLADLGGINYVDIPDWLNASGVCFPWLGYKYYIFVGNKIKEDAMVHKRATVYHEMGHCEFLIPFHSDELIDIMHNGTPSDSYLMRNWYKMVAKFFKGMKDD